MGKIICFMGKSSSGKDTIYKRLLEDKESGLSMLIPYTTRPIRGGEKDGIEYNFTDEAGYRKLLEEKKIIEERTYNTYHGLWRYFTVNDGLVNLGHKSYGIIGTIDSYNKLCDFFGSGMVIPVLVEVDDGVRLQRALDREKAQDNPKYEEMCRRYLSDCEDFAEDKIIKAGITKRFYNNELENCLEEIKIYIREKLRGCGDGYKSESGY